MGFALLSVAAGCSRGEGDAGGGLGSASDVEAPSSVGGPGSTTSSSSTTAAPTTTTTVAAGPTTTSRDQLEAHIRELHERFMVEVFGIDEREEGVLASHLAVIDELTAGPQHQRLLDFVDLREDEGLAMVGPGYDSNVYEVRFEGDTIRVFDCSRDRSEGYSRATGELVVEADDFFKIRSTFFEQVDEEWKVVEFFAGGDVRCDPATEG